MAMGIWGRAKKSERRGTRGRGGGDPRQPENWLINITAASTALLNSSGVVAGVQAGSGDARSEALDVAEEGSQVDLRIGK